MVNKLERFNEYKKSHKHGKQNEFSFVCDLLRENSIKIIIQDGVTFTQGKSYTRILSAQWE